MANSVNLEEALSIYRAQQFGNRVGFGERPAVIVVDFFYGCTDPAYLGGGKVSAAVNHTASLLPRARAAGIIGPAAFLLLRPTTPG